MAKYTKEKKEELIKTLRKIESGKMQSAIFSKADARFMADSLEQLDASAKVLLQADVLRAVNNRKKAELYKLLDDIKNKICGID